MDLSLYSPPIAALRLEGVSRPWLWALLVVALAAILVASYREISRRTESGLARGLLALRALGVLALVLALAKPTWTRESEEVDPGRVAVILDNSASMSLPDPTGRPRYDRARDAVAAIEGALDADRSGPRTRLDRFDIHGEPASANATPDVDRTDLVLAVKGAIAKLRARPLAGVVVVSDGMDNTGRPDLRELADSPVPIHAVGFPPDTAAAGALDLAVRDVRGPGRAMVHNQVKVDVTLAKTGGPATRATLTLKRGKETFASLDVALNAGDSERVVRLDLTPNQPGTFVFTATAAADSGERLLANNSGQVSVRVDAEPIRVLYLEGFLRYESKYLKNRLEDDPDVSLVSVIRRANPGRGDARDDDGLFTAERLKRFDVVILGDMEGSYLKAAEYQALLKWLDEKDHAVLALGGYRSYGPDGFRSTPLAEALPVRFAGGEPYQSEEPFVLRLTEEGRRHPIFEVTGDRVKDAAAWGSTPALSGTSLVLGAKPAAEVLAVDPGVRVEGQPAVVVAVQRFGAGHTMALAADTTWRWSRLTRVVGRSDTLYSRFWSQTVRWLAGRSGDDRRPPLAVSTDRPDYEPGKPVAIRALRQPGPGQDLADAAVTLDVNGPSGRTVAVPLRANSAEPDTFLGTFIPSASGRYEVAAALTAGGKTIANQATEFLVHGADLERADTGTNRPALQALAAACGGSYADVDDAAAIAARLPRKERRSRLVRRTEFWNSPALFLGFVGFVSAEWFLRRRHQLV